MSGRKVSARHVTGRDTEVRPMVPVKRIGRLKNHLYCERCGSKRTACRCSEVRDG